jgi:RNA polymerase sigma-32 factor
MLIGDYLGLERRDRNMASTAITRTNELDRYIAQISQYPLLSQEEETRLARRWRDLQDVEAAHTLVTANLRFVVKIANEYRGYGARVLDLIQEGSVGLMQAVKRFDPDKGYRLLSYAVYWIRSQIHSYLMKTTRMIRIGTSRAHRKLFFKLRAIKGALTASGMDNQDEIIDAVAHRVGVSREDVEEMDRHLTGSDASLDAPSVATGTAMIEVLPSGGQSQEEMLAELETEADHAARLEVALETLNENEKTVIELRHLSESPMQLHEIGDKLGISKQRVYQIEKKAIQKLREAVVETLDAA